MAAPITHIVLTNKIFHKYFNDKDKRKFYIGTSFPDIRYMGVIDREKTHYTELKLSKIVKEKSFNAGLKFHSYLDKVREDYVVSKGIYDLVPKSPYITQAIKFLEDEVLYDKIDDWADYIAYFDTLIDEEKGFDISEDALFQWHKTLQRTFLQKPNAKDLEEFVANIGRPKEMADEINSLLPEIRVNQNVLEILEDLYNSFEELIENEDK